MWRRSDVAESFLHYLPSFRFFGSIPSQFSCLVFCWLMLCFTSCLCPLVADCLSLSGVQQRPTLFLRLRVLWPWFCPVVWAESSSCRKYPAKYGFMFKLQEVRLIYPSWNLNSLWSGYLTCKIRWISPLQAQTSSLTASFCILLYRKQPTEKLGFEPSTLSVGAALLFPLASTEN